MQATSLVVHGKRKPTVNWWLMFNLSGMQFLDFELLHGSMSKPIEAIVGMNAPIIWHFVKRKENSLCHCPFGNLVSVNLQQVVLGAIL
jgi:hypothetical protein